MITMAASVVRSSATMCAGLRLIVVGAPGSLESWSTKSGMNLYDVASAAVMWSIRCMAGDADVVDAESA